jgi:hypothetical protein
MIENESDDKNEISKHTYKKGAPKARNPMYLASIYGLVEETKAKYNLTTNKACKALKDPDSDAYKRKIGFEVFEREEVFSKGSTIRDWYNDALTERKNNPTSHASQRMNQIDYGLKNGLDVDET